MSITLSKICWATGQSKHSMDHIVALADKLTTDPDKKNRLIKSECKPCYYINRVGGCVITHKECMICGIEVTSSSTDVSVLCVPCAKEHSLCSHCGGDLNLRVGRRKC